MDVNFPKLEEEVLERWRKEKTFEQSVQKRKGKRRFVFYEGPPTANAGPGIHHVLTRVFKDIILRYKTMRGFLVERRAGWDTHGLPVELQIEKKLGLKSKKDIEKYGIAKFNAECKKSVWEFKKDWENLTERIGFWLDMSNPYITYETSYIEILWSIIKKFWQKKLLYKDYKVVPFCIRCGTALSSHELAQGYKQVKDQSVYIKFKLKPGQKIGDFTTDNSTYILSWTTTPWTLPGNVALAVGEDITYLKYWRRINDKKESFIVAEELYRKEPNPFVPKADLIENGAPEFGVDIEKFKGKNFIGLKYQPLFDIKALQNENSHKIYGADFVTTTEGTGVVHTAVMYGEDDYKLGKKVGLPQHHTVDEQGKFTNEVPGLEGLPVITGTEKDKETENKILEILKARGSLLETASYPHEYPFCWRCSTPLLYYAKESWFVNVQKVKQKLLANNGKINWIPSHIKKGRMGEWLKEVKDWAFSRERYWGTPLPLWQCVSCKAFEAIGSLQELLKKKFSKNSYFVMRHGYTERNKENIMSCWPEKTPFPLLPKGIEEVRKAARELKKKNIDLIFSSDLLRTKQTAQILGKELGIEPILDSRLRELNVGILNGRPIAELGKLWGKLGESKREHYLRRFVDSMPKGESYLDVQKRMYEFLKDIDQQYSGKNILIVSHERPITLLEGTVLALTRNEIVDYSEVQKKYLKTGQWRKLPFTLLPYNNDMEIDLHRPFVDDVSFECPLCKKGRMERVKEVVDVWFDSGSMPFAQNKWMGGKPKLFPADYIVEGIDQTRGWFYTLLAVSTLLGFEAPYKNVISLGHVLDAKGEKMSKSKGNVVNPWEIIKKYGIDAVRWYFYTINNPGDAKLFSEKDIQQSTRNFLLTFWNCFVFYDTYSPKQKSQKKKLQPENKNILDDWILLRLNRTTQVVTQKLDSYDVTEAARALQNFVVQDLSLWYIRRSRGRAQEVSPTLRFILSQACKLAAPFIPFLSEHMFKGLGEKKSVHFQDFPASLETSASRPPMNKKLEEQMEWLRNIAAKALAERAKAGIKVRQPLALLKIRNPEHEIRDDLLEVLKDEVNVKKVSFDKNLRQDVELDTRITPELKKEGMLREIVRQIQGMRKDAGYKPSDAIVVFCAGDSELCLLLSKEVKMFKSQEPTLQTADLIKEILVDQKKLRLGIKKS